MITRPPAPSRCRLLIPWAAALAAAPFAVRAQTGALALDQIVVSATRTAQDPAYLPSSVTALSLPALDDMQIPDLRTALSQTPGVIVANSGAAGSQSSIFLRGANSDLTLFVVDGVRLNTGNISYANFLGGADLSGLDRLEVLRGPQSTLYGSSAMGGVILLETTRGSGSPSGVVSTYAGSFGSLGAQAAVAGGAGTFGYSASIAHEQTDNDRPYNRYRNWNYSTRLEDSLAPWLLAGVTLRGEVGNYEEPGALPVTPGEAGDIATTTDLATAYLEARAGDKFRSRLTTGWYQDEYTFDDGSAFDFYYARKTREILDWQNTWEAAPWMELVAGLNSEASPLLVGRPDDRPLDFAEYISAILHPSAGLQITGEDVRHDHFDTAGGAATEAALGAAYRAGATKLRATYGTGFNAPTPTDRYGLLPSTLPNPAVRPETSRGRDAGIDQGLLDGRATVSATFFENRFRDLLEYEVVDPISFAGSEVNVDRATTRGVELAASAKINSVFAMHGGYTYLDAWDDVTGTRLIRRPRHTLDLDLQAHVSRDWLFGTGMHLVTDRLDGAFVPAPLAGYTTVRIYASYAIRPHLLLKLRVEKISLDRNYEEVTGYPALPRAFYRKCRMAVLTDARLPGRLIVVLFGLAAALRGGSGPVRVVSQTVGTDEMLLALADSAQIAALSQLARDPEYSAVAAQASSYPALKPNGDAESVLKYRPTLVLCADYSRAELIAQLRRAGIRILIFDRYATIEDDYANLRRLAVELGAESRAESLIARCRERVAALSRSLRGVKPARVIAPSVYGLIPGADTTFQDLCDHAGAINLASTVGRLRGHAPPPVEAMLNWPVDCRSNSGGTDLQNARWHRFAGCPPMNSWMR